MKKFLAIFLLASVTFSAVAKDKSAETVDYPKNEFALSFSGPSLMYFSNALGGLFTSVLGDTEPASLNSTGVISLSYYRHVGKHFAFGLIGGYESLDMTIDGGQTTSNCIMAMPAMKFIWFRGNVCSMYSKVAAGCDFVKNQDEEGIQCAFTGQFSPIAIELGGKNLRGFAELGFGAQGIAGIGVRYAF